MLRIIEVPLELVFTAVYLSVIPVEWIIFLAERLGRMLTGRLVQYPVKGKVALVTGGGSGIGRATCVLLAERGCHVIVLDFHASRAEEVAALVKGHAVTCDVSDRHAVKEVTAKLLDKYGKIDILVNNAGILGENKLMLNTRDEVNLKVFGVNALAHFWTSKALVPKMIEDNSGCIVTVASTASNASAPFCVDYSASKHAVKGFHDAISAELYAEGYDGINTLLVMPNLTATGLFTQMPERGFMAPPVTTPEEVAAWIVDGIEKKKRQVLAIPHLFLLKVSSCPALVTHLIKVFKFNRYFETAPVTKPEQIWNAKN